MKHAIEEVVRVALRFWNTGEGEPYWKEEAWDVCPISLAREDGLKIAIIGPTDREQRFRADVIIHPRDFTPAKPSGEDLPEESLLRLLPKKVRNTLIKYAHSGLFFPGPQQTEAWARGQVAVYFLQRGWVRPQETEAWVWQECLVPLFECTVGGRRALEDGLIGFETLRSMVVNYVNPLRRGGFKAYVRTIVRRAQTAAMKRRAAEVEHTSDAATGALNRQRFNAFVRQRRRRGEEGVVVRKGRIEATEVTWDKLVNAWISQAKRKDIARALVARMVEAGAKSDSARRQVRRWLRADESPKLVAERIRAWRPRE